LLLREAAQRTGLLKALRDLHTMLAQRIIAIASGYEDLNDDQTLREDPAEAFQGGGSGGGQRASGGDSPGEQFSLPPGVPDGLRAAYWPASDSVGRGGLEGQKSRLWAVLGWGGRGKRVPGRV
jgi:hypothetical protein